MNPMGIDSNTVFVSGDGDKIGRRVGQAVLQDQPEEVARIASLIDRGNRIFTNWALSSRGAMVDCGGDEFRITVPADALTALPGLMEQYQNLVGATISVGVGAKMSESAKALLVAKLKGGGQISVYDNTTEDTLLAVKEKNEAEKLQDEYGAALKSEGPERVRALMDLAAVSEVRLGEVGVEFLLNDNWIPEDCIKSISWEDGQPLVKAIPPNSPLAPSVLVPRSALDSSDGANGGPGIPMASPGDNNPPVMIGLAEIETKPTEAPQAPVVTPEAKKVTLPGMPNLQDKVRATAQAALESQVKEHDGNASAAAEVKARLAQVMQNLQNKDALLALVQSSPGIADSIADLVSAIRDIARILPGE